MDSTLEAALGQPSALVFVAVEIVLGSKTLRLLDGQGTVGFSSMTFIGQDPAYGPVSLDGVSLNDGVAAAAPSLTLTLYPASDVDAGDLLEDAVPGGSVRLWLGVVDYGTGLTVGAPDLLFAGEIDVATINLDKNVCNVTLAVTSIWDRMLQPNQKVALNGAMLKSYFPAATGLDKVYLNARTVPWGAALPASPAATKTAAASPLSVFNRVSSAP